MEDFDPNDLLHQSESPHLAQCLTQDEFRLVFIVAFTAVAEGFVGAYPLERYATDGLEGSTDDWTELWRRAIRFLTFECDATFEGVEAKRDGRILAREVEPRNMIYVHGLRQGDSPDPLRCIEAAIAMAPTKCPGLLLGPLHDLKVMIRGQLDEIQMDDDPRIQREMANLTDHALESIGLRRIPYGGTVH